MLASSRHAGSSTSNGAETVNLPPISFTSIAIAFAAELGVDFLISLLVFGFFAGEAMKSGRTDFEFAETVVDQLDAWVNSLARPIVPPRQMAIGDKYVRLEFQQHLPHTVMVGKLVRAASAMSATFALTEIGFVTGAGALLRIVSDLCTEIGRHWRRLEEERRAAEGG